ncbi:MAG: L-dopachrome tautomerase-related protein [Phycisphaeraceae bacterium]
MQSVHSLARPVVIVRYVAACLLAGALPLLAGCASRSQAQDLVQGEIFEPVWEKLLVQVAEFPDAMPTGVAVSSSGRLFVNFPYWSDKPRDAVPYARPTGTIRPLPNETLNNSIYAQALVVDDQDFLWMLDSGKPQADGGVQIAGAKLVKIDTGDDSIAAVFNFDSANDLAPHSFLSDFCIDTENQFAYIADSGRGCIIVYNLKSGQAHHALLDDRSTKAEKGVTPWVGSEPWRKGRGYVPQFGVNGVALSPDNNWLYYHALTGRTLYRIPTAPLRDNNLSDDQLASLVQSLGSTGSIVDGMLMDQNGNLYMTAPEKNAILVRRSNGSIETFIADQRIQWPDSLALAKDGYLYFTVSMRHFHEPYSHTAERAQPFYVMKTSITNVQIADANRHDAEAAWVAADAAAQEAAETAWHASLKRATASEARQAATAKAEQAAEAQEWTDAAAQIVAQAEDARSRAAQAADEAAAIAAEYAKTESGDPAAPETPVAPVNNF